MTLDEILDELRALRLERDQADAKLLLRLVEVERDHMRLILDSGCESFAQWLESEALPSPGRYEAFKRGLAKFDDPSIALDIGSDATIVAAHLLNGDGPAPKAGAYVHAVMAWAAEHGGTLPSRETARRTLLEVDPREVTSQAVKRQDELARLRAAYVELQAENRALVAKIDKLEAKIAKLTKRGQRQTV